jgi:uncharacterized membrane protein
VALFLLALATLLFWFAGRYVPPIGQFFGFVCTVPANLFTRLEHYLQAFQTKADSIRPGLCTIVRSLLGSVASLACGSEVYGGIQAAGTLFAAPGAPLPDTTVPFLPSNLATVSLGVTFLCLAILAGFGYMEAEGYIPVQARVLEHLDQQKTERLQHLMLWCLGLSLVATFFAFLERKMYQINSISPVTFVLQLVVFALLGILLPLLSMFAWFYITVAIEALVALLLGIVHFLVSLARDLFLYLARYFAGDMQQTGTKATTLPQEEQPALPAQANVLVISSESEEIEMKTDAYVSTVYAGSDGIRMQKPMREKIAQLGATRFFRFQEPVDLLATRAGTLAGATSWQEAYEKLLHEVENKLVQVNDPLRGMPTLGLHFLDYRIGIPSLSYLHGLKDRLPLQTQVVITFVSEHEMHEAAQPFLRKLDTLCTNRVIEAYVLLDPTSQFALRHSAEKLREHAAQGFVSLICAHTHSPQNPHAIEVFQELRRFGQAASLSFATNDTITGETPKGSLLTGFISLFSKKAVAGSVDDMLAIASGAHEGLTQKVLKQQECRAWDGKISASLPLFLHVNFPLRLDDRRFAIAASVNDRNVKDQFHLAHTAAVRGNGLRYDDRIPALFRVGVTCFFPLPEPVIHDHTEEATEEEIIVKPEQEVSDTLSSTASALVPATVETPPPAPVQTLNGHGRGRPAKTVRKK